MPSVTPGSYPISRRASLQQLGGWALACSAGIAEAKPLAPAAAHLPLHVLLISNAAYQHAPPLHNPHQDAQLLQQAFSQRGAQVHHLRDLTGAQLTESVANFLQQVSSSPACVWIVYSGHAVQIDGRNYLQGVDSQFDTAAKIRKQGCNLGLLLGLLEQQAPKAAVFSLDACRNNPFEPLRTRSATQGLAIQDPQGICISFSTAPYTKALDGDPGQYSPYAKALSHALGGTQRKSLDQVLRETANLVYLLTQRLQTPEYRSALRSEWWFQEQSVQLLPSSDNAPHAALFTAAPPTTSRRTREVSYRPDTPEAAPASQDLLHPLDERRQQLVMLFLALPEAARKQIQGGPWEGFTNEKRLMASLYAQQRSYAAPLNAAMVRTLLEPLAQAGDVLAQHLLGDAFFHDAIYDQAYKWLSVAARAGYAPPQPATVLPSGLANAIQHFSAPAQAAHHPLKAAMMGL